MDYRRTGVTRCSSMIIQSNLKSRCHGDLGSKGQKGLPLEPKQLVSRVIALCDIVMDNMNLDFSLTSTSKNQINDSTTGDNLVVLPDPTPVGGGRLLGGA